MFKAPSDATATPTDAPPQRKRSNSFSNYFWGTSDNSAGDLSEAERQLRAQRKLLLDQARSTASAITTASNDNESQHGHGGGTADLGLDSNAELKLREQAVEVARRALLAEQQQLALHRHQGGSQQQQQPEHHHDAPTAQSTTSNVNTDSSFDLMDDEFASPREMTSEDIQQLVFSSSSEASTRVPAVTGGSAPVLAVASQYKHGDATELALHRRHAKVSMAVHLLRTSAASGMRTAEHNAVLERYGFSTAPPTPGGPNVPQTLCHVEALARTAAHTHLAEHLQGKSSTATRSPTSTEAMLITF